MTLPMILFWTCLAALATPFLLAAYTTLRNKFRTIDVARNEASYARQEAARIRAVEADMRRTLAQETTAGKLAELKKATRGKA